MKVLQLVDYLLKLYKLYTTQRDMIDKDHEFKEKHHKDVFLARGGVLELSTIMEKRLNEILLKIGNVEIPDHFRTKAKLVEDLMLKLTSEIEREKFKTFQDFVTLRNIFAHVPIKWYSHQKVEFESEGPYKNFFKTNPEWKDFDIAINYFYAISGNAINLIEKFVTWFNTNEQMKREIDKEAWGLDMPLEMKEKIYRIGNKMKQDMEKKREALRGKRELGNDFGFKPS